MPSLADDILTPGSVNRAPGPARAMDNEPSFYRWDDDPLVINIPGDLAPARWRRKIHGPTAQG